MAHITVIPLFKKKALAAGATGTSDPIDLREICQHGNFAVTYTTEGGTSTTAGTTTFSYVGGSLLSGPYGSPATYGTFGTSGTGKAESGILSGSNIIPVAFMKVIIGQTGAGGAGAQSKVTAELHVQ